MKCPICHVDHFMLCHSCPHRDTLSGLEYKDSPCRFCDKDQRGKQRENDSREIGHSRVVSLEQVERYVKENVPDEADEQDVSEGTALMQDFVRRFCGLDIRVQFMFEQREFFGRSLEDVAAMYRSEFKTPMTPAGVSIALKSARARMRRRAT